jgi:MATE family multidrug resistance protein
MGVVISVIMLTGRQIAANLLVPPEAQAIFFLPWLAALLVQPLNGIAFVTDGIHWGTGDYAYLRNAVLLATLVGSLLLLSIDIEADNALFGVWVATVVWIIIRAFLGILRIWPGIGHAPLASGPGFKFNLQ